MKEFGIRVLKILVKIIFITFACIPVLFVVDKWGADKVIVVILVAIFFEIPKE